MNYKKIIFESVYDKYMAIAEVTIFGVEYINSQGIIDFTYVTNNSKYIKTKSKKPIDDINDVNYYLFYDLCDEKWRKIYHDKKHNHFVTHFYNLDEFNIKTPVNILSEKDEIIEKYNNSILNDVNKKIQIDVKNKISLKEEIKKYKGKVNLKIFNIYFTLLKSSVLTFDQCLFNCIFNISVDNYKTNNFNAEEIKTTYHQVLDFFKQKAISNLESEIIGLNSDELEEINLIKEMIEDNVSDTKTKYENLENNEDIVDMFEDWPAILMPTPEFIADRINDTAFQDCIWAFQKND